MCGYNEIKQEKHEIAEKLFELKSQRHKQVISGMSVALGFHVAISRQRSRTTDDRQKKTSNTGKPLSFQNP